MGRHSTIKALPKAVRAWLEGALLEGSSTYQQLEDVLREQGFSISKSAIHRFGQPLLRRLAAIKASTEAARMLTEGAADDQDTRSEAIIALIQTELFESIVTLQEATDEKVDPADRVALLSKVAKNIATLTRASVNLKKFQQDLRERLAEKMQALEAEAAAPGSGLDLQTIRRIAQDVYGVFE